MTKYQTGILPIPSNLSTNKRKMIKAMEEGGCTVILEDGGMAGQVVKVRKKGQRQIRSASTSGYPIQHAFEKWQLENWGTV